MAYLETRRDLTHGGEQVTFKGLQKERPLQRELSRTTDHHSRRLRATGRLDALLQKIIRTDETTAAMGAQGASTKQGRIAPSQGLFQKTPIAGFDWVIGALEKNGFPGPAGAQNGYSEDNFSKKEHPISQISSSCADDPRIASFVLPRTGLDR